MPNVQSFLEGSDRGDRLDMSSFFRKLNLTAHVACSVGWLGSVGAFLVLSVAGSASRNPETARGAYVAMNLIGEFVIVPLSLAALLTGLIQSLGTSWGLFRHYWVLVKFALTIGAIGLLLVHQFTAVAEAARRVMQAEPGTLPNVTRLGTQLVVDSSLALLALIATTTLSVYKPWGRTPYGRRWLALDPRKPAPELTRASASEVVRSTKTGPPSGFRIVMIMIGVMLAVIVLLHLTGRGLGGHRP